MFRMQSGHSRAAQGMIVGYARTSPADQTDGLAMQARDLAAAGAERVVGEQVSITALRAKLPECLASLRVGDVLTVTKPDRLARSIVRRSMRRHCSRDRPAEL